MALGMLIIIPAAKWISFPVFLLALFVNGIGQTLLNASVNPYITILGPVRSAAQRISIMGICNKLSFGLAPIALAVFMDTSNVQLDDAIGPFYAIAGILTLLGVLSYFAPLPDIKAAGEDDNGPDSAYANTKSSILQFPHLLMGVVAVFFYVGVETIALTSINDFAFEINLPFPEKFSGYTSAGYVVGYFLGTLLIPRFVSQINAMIGCAVLGVVSSLLILFLPVTCSLTILYILIISVKKPNTT